MALGLKTLKPASILVLSMPSSQLTLPFATCRTYDEPAFIFITPGEKGWHHGRVSPDRERDIQGPCNIKNCRFDPTFANKFPVPDFSYWHRCVRNAMLALIRTFSSPSVVPHRDRSQMLCSEEGHASAQVKGLLHATAQEASLEPVQEGVVWREKSPATLLTASPLGYCIQPPSSCVSLPNVSLPLRHVSEMRGSDTVAGEPAAGSGKITVPPV